VTASQREMLAKERGPGFDRTLSDRVACLILAVTFALSRAAYYWAGVRFDIDPLYRFYQFVDPELLRNRLFETTWYMHTQPPGFNFLAGLLVKLSSDRGTLTWLYGGLYLAMGLGIALLVYWLQRELGVRPWIALVLSTLFSVAPGTVLHENLFLYEYPQLLALLAATVAAIRFFRTGKKGWAVLFFAVVAGLPVFRATYHLLWAVIAGAVFVFLAWRWGRRSAIRPGTFRFTAVLAALACLPCLILYAKNYKLYGQFAGSTWLGEQASTLTVWQLTPEKREEFIAKGLISSIGRIPAASPLADYREFLHPVAATGIPILDQRADSTGRDNLNNLLYLQTGDYYIRDAKTLLRIYPQCYVKSLAIAWFTYFLPASDFPFFTLNRPKIAGWDRAFNVAIYGQWKDASDRKGLRREGMGPGMILYEATYLMVLLPALFVFGCWEIWRLFCRSGGNVSSLAGLSFMIFTIATVSFISTALSSFECNRYRFPLDGFFVVLAGLAATRLLGARKNSRSVRTDRSAPPFNGGEVS